MSCLSLPCQSRFNVILIFLKLLCSVSVSVCFMSGVCLSLVSPSSLDSVHNRSYWYDVVVGLPTFIFVVFLAVRAPSAIRKLVASQSQIMATYYTFLWLVCALNVMRCILQVILVETGKPNAHDDHGDDSKGNDDPGTPHDIIASSNTAAHDTLLNVLWLFARFGLTFLEASVVIFLGHGYLSSGRDALVRTLQCSTAVAGIDLVVKAVLIFAVHVPLFMTTPDSGSSKWAFWTIHNLLLSLVYAAVLVLPLTPLRDRLPARPSFFRYVAVLLAIDATATIGSTLLLAGATSAGSCVYALANATYYAGYPWLLYVTFLADFFSTVSSDNEQLYYASMDGLDDTGLEALLGDDAVDLTPPVALR